MEGSDANLYVDVDVGAEAVGDEGWKCGESCDRWKINASVMWIGDVEMERNADNACICIRIRRRPLDNGDFLRCIIRDADCIMVLLLPFEIVSF